MPTNTRSTIKGPAVTQAEKRRGIDVGPRIGQVSTAAYWYRSGQFTKEDEAKGAFRLAYQQGLDGMGTSTAEWMGLTDDEYDAWMRRDELPNQKASKGS